MLDDPRHGVLKRSLLDHLCAAHLADLLLEGPTSR
jgi:hypothetical protein